MSEILNELPIKGDMPGIRQADVINQSHPGFIGPMPEYNIQDELQMGYPPDIFGGPLLKGGKVLSRFKNAISNLYKGEVPTSVLKKMPAGMLAKHGIRAAWRPSSVPRLTPEQLLTLRSPRPAIYSLASGVFPKTKEAAQYGAKQKWLHGGRGPLAEHTNPAWVLDDLGLPKTEYGDLGGMLGKIVNPGGARIGRQVHPGDMGSRGFDILDEAYTGGRMVRGGPSKPTVAPGRKTPKVTSNIPVNPVTPMDKLNFQYKNVSTEYGVNFNKLKKIADSNIKRGHSPEDAYYWALEDLLGY